MAAPEWIETLIGAAADTARVPVEILRALVEKESGFDPNAIGNAGEFGLAQLKDAAAAEVGVNRYSPADNVLGGALYLRKQYDATGNWYDALRAYNAGPSAAAGNLEAGRAYAADVLNRTPFGGEAIAAPAPGFVSRVLGGAKDLAPDWIGRYFNVSTPAVAVVAILLIGGGVLALVFSARRAAAPALSGMGLSR